MPFLCCKQQLVKADVDPASPQHDALETRRGSVVIATIVDAPLSGGKEDSLLGLVLQEVTPPAKKWQQQRQYSHNHNHIEQPHHAIIVVERIDPQSPFRNTPLREGMILFRINDRNIENYSLAQVEKLLQNAKRPLRLWAQQVEGTAFTHQKTSSTSPPSTTPRRNGVAASSTKGKNNITAAKMILAVAHKEEIHMKVGLSLRRSQSGTFAVHEILPTSPFYSHDRSLLREGMIITSINGLSITGMEMEVALSAIRDAPGSIILAAEIPATIEEPPMIRRRIVAVIHKSSPDQPTGLSLIRIPQSGSVTSSHMRKQEFKTVMGRIAPNCPFRDTDLQVGFEITSVNGLNVARSDARAILHHLQESWGKIVVLAEMDVPVDATIATSSQRSSVSISLSPVPTTNSTSTSLCTSNKTIGSSSSHSGPVLMTVSVLKHSQGQKLGIKLSDDSLGSFFVTQISSDSPFHSTCLQVGAEVMTINGVQLPGLDMAFVSLLLTSIVGEVVLTFLLPPHLQQDGESASSPVRSSLASPPPSPSFQVGLC